MIGAIGSALRDGRSFGVITPCAAASATLKEEISFERAVSALNG
jgi:hypothetical protein